MTDSARSHRPSRTTLDEVSRRIVASLQEDGRRSYASLGKDVGLSEAAVRQRVQKLIDTGAVRIVALADPAQLGVQRQAMIGVRVTGEVDEVADALASMAQVDSVAVTAGSFDLLVEVACTNDRELLELVSRRIRGLGGVVSTETFLYLERRKQAYPRGAD